jgi:lipid-binding SYLF domain-containing protein
LPLAKNYEYKRQRKYCSDECQYATAREKQAATNAARKLAEQQAQAEKVKQAEVVAGARRVNVYREVHRKAREFAGVGKKAY